MVDKYVILDLKLVDEYVILDLKWKIIDVYYV